MKILILVLSADFPPYGKMIETAINTWDSVEVEEMETVYYCGRSNIEDTNKIIHLPIHEGLLNIGHKTIAALEWALNNNDFDYIARVHSSIYVDKKRLKEYVYFLPIENLFAGVETNSVNGFQYCWGGVGYIISRDVVQRLVDNKQRWCHQHMEDESMSKLAGELGIPFFPLKSSGIDYMGNDEWRIISYNGESISFTNFEDIKRLNHHYYRIKVDGNRDRDEYVMNQLFKVL